MSLVKFVVVKMGTASINIGVADYALFLREAAVISLILFIKRKDCQEQRSNRRTHRTRATKQQLKYGEHALACSGDQLLLGHLYALISRYSNSIIARKEGRVRTPVRRTLERI